MSEIKQRKYIEVIPSARRLINSLRNLRYDFGKAVADIVDNSIQAGATRVDIFMKFEGEHSWIRIADNGKGMTSEEINEAMRLGTKRDYDKNELGRFGVGMKTASISQCRRLTVASRSNVEGADIGVRRFDLDEIEQSDSFEIIDIPPEQVSPKIIEPLKNTNGTVIFWEALDRIMKYRIPSGAAANKKFNQMIRELEDHLSMVFHMFLSGKVKNKELKITLNGNKLEPWDPFARSEKGTLQFAEDTLALQGPAGPYSVKYSSFILPTQDRFSSREAFEKYGRGKWNELQGFYIYRENRLIQYGGWSNLRRPDEHIKFARVGLYFYSDADEALDIDVKKSDINIPDNLRETLIPIVRKVTAAADKLYRSEEGIIQIQSRSHSGFAGNTERVPEDDSGAKYKTSSENTISDQNRPENDENDSREVVRENDHKSFGKEVSTESGETFDPESRLDILFDRLNQRITEHDSDTELILRSLRELFSVTFQVAAETVGREEAFEKIVRKIKLNSPHIASFLGV